MFLFCTEALGHPVQFSFWNCSVLSSTDIIDEYDTWALVVGRPSQNKLPSRNKHLLEQNSSDLSTFTVLIKAGAQYVTDHAELWETKNRSHFTGRRWLTLPWGKNWAQITGKFRYRNLTEIWICGDWRTSLHCRWFPNANMHLPTDIIHVDKSDSFTLKQMRQINMQSSRKKCN